MNSHRCRHAQSPRFKPRLQALEDRTSPAVAIFTFGGTMFVLGDGSANTVTLDDKGDGTITATITSSTNTATRTADVVAVVVLTGGGADTVNYKLANPLTAGRALLVDLGSGNDTATIDASAGVNSSALAVAVLGGDGADNVKASVDTIDVTSNGLLNGTLAVAVAGGSGNDMLSANLNIAAGSTGRLAAAVLGGFGDDNLTLNVNDDSGAGGASTLAFLYAAIDGGPGIDTCTHTDNVAVFNCEL
jgi:hypothetical protein